MDEQIKKLYPPVIEGTIPAFYGTTLVVPFSMNRAVGKNDIIGFSLKIKTIQTNTFVANIESKNYDISSSKVSFDISSLIQTSIKEQMEKEGKTADENAAEDKLVAGQYYKIQLAYIHNDEYKTVGYYSIVGVVKYYGLNGPKIYIEGLSDKKSNLFAGYYLGVFDHEEDPTEKISQYRFVITYSGTDEIFYDTGWIVHNTINDSDSLSANDMLKYTDDLDGDKTYYLQYKVITSNKMECSSPKYNILQKESIGTELRLEFTAETDYDNGFVALRLKSLGKNGDNATLTGAFEISRQNIKTPRHWEVIDLFILQNEVATKTFWRDFTVTHGETYRYAIRQFNEAGVYTNRVLSNEVFVDFEDAYLYDGKRQLKIRYNPKVSSFKNDIPESKTDTIGSKYPFIFRNGHVNYKEFPISGLISYWSDEQHLFMSFEDIDIVDGEKLERREELPWNLKTTDLTNYNIAAERKFKLEVLEWLTNGKPKLFRSPTEGNYIVRLLNTNLTPTDTVGRMLHTFSSTAYEVAECDYDNLVYYGFIDNGLSDKDKYRNYYRTVPLGKQGHENEVEYQAVITGDNPNYPADGDYIELLRDPYSGKQLHAYAIYFDDMNSGDVVIINGREHIIGNTGQFILEKSDDIESVKIKKIKAPYFDKDAYNKAVDEYNERKIIIEPRISELNESIAVLDLALQEQEERIETFYNESPIIIENPTVIEYNELIDQKREEIEDKFNERQQYNNEELVPARENYESKARDVSVKMADIDNKQNDINTINEQIDEKQARINELNVEIQDKEDAIAFIREDINILNPQIESLAEEIEEIEDLDIDEIRDEKTRLNDLITSTTEVINRINAFLGNDSPNSDANKIRWYLNAKETRDAALAEEFNVEYGQEAFDLKAEYASGLEELEQSIAEAISNLPTVVRHPEEVITSEEQCLQLISSVETEIDDYELEFQTNWDLIEQDPGNAETYRSNLIDIITNLQDAQDRLAVYNRYLITYHDDWVDYSDLIDQNNELQTKYDRLNELLSTFSEETAAQVSAANAAYTRSINSEVIPSTYGNTGIENTTLTVAELDEIIRSKEELLTSKTAELEQHRADLNEVLEQETKYESLQAKKIDYMILTTYKSILQNNISDYENEIDLLEVERDTLINERDSLISGETLERYLEELEALEAELEELQAIKAEAKEVYDEAQNNYNELDDAYNALLEEEVALKQEKYDYIHNDIETDALIVLKRRLNDLIKNLKDLNDELKDLEYELAAVPLEDDYKSGQQNYILEDYNGLFTYKYTDLYANSFDLIAGQTLVDVPCRQFVGANMDDNILNQIIDVRTELINILQIQAELKQIEDIYTWEDNSYIGNLPSMDYDEFVNKFSFDKIKMPGENSGNSYGEIIGQTFNPKADDSTYIYKIHPIIKREECHLDDDIPNGYINTLSPWEKEELRLQTQVMLNKYNLTINQVSNFMEYEDNGETVIYVNPQTNREEEKTIREMISIIKLTKEDYFLLEKYFGKEKFNYNTFVSNPYEKSLVVYFSMTGNTRRVAKKIASLIDADIYEIKAAVPYTAEDLDPEDTTNRIAREREDPDCRPEIAGEDIDLSQYKTIYLGYPLWHERSPRIIDTFVQKYNFNGITIIPFCTSGKTDIAESDDELAYISRTGNWKQGKRYSGNVIDIIVDEEQNPHYDVINVYHDGKWEPVPVEYHKNEGYYVDATYYTVNNFTPTLDSYDFSSELFDTNKKYYEKRHEFYVIIDNPQEVLFRDWDEDVSGLSEEEREAKKKNYTPYKYGWYEKTGYREFNKYYLFGDGKDYYLVYKPNDNGVGRFQVVEGYSPKIYINTGVTEGVVAANNELYTADGQILQPYIDLSETGEFKTTLIPEITDIYVGDGVILNLSYQTREIKYIVEENDEELKEKRERWQDQLTAYTDLFYKRKDTVEERYDFYDEEWRNSDFETRSQDAQEFLRNANIAKVEYLECLTRKIAEYKEEHGIE